MNGQGGLEVLHGLSELAEVPPVNPEVVESQRGLLGISQTAVRLQARLTVENCIMNVGAQVEVRSHHAEGDDHAEVPR